MISHLRSLTILILPGKIYTSSVFNPFSDQCNFLYKLRHSKVRNAQNIYRLVAGFNI